MWCTKAQVLQQYEGKRDRKKEVGEREGGRGSDRERKKDASVTAFKLQKDAKSAPSQVYPPQHLHP